MSRILNNIINMIIVMDSRIVNDGADNNMAGIFEISKLERR